MSDVSAIALSIGEDTAAGALESIRRQTLPVREIIAVREVAPFSKAFNAGAAQVTTDFFVQVDADMVLDDTCIEHLRGCIGDGVGLVLASLRDPLMGRVGWVKLFRRACCDAVPYPDLVTSDVSFAAEIVRRGWSIVYAINPCPGLDRELWHTLGQHRPSYTPAYTFFKYLREGRRHRSQGDAAALRWHLKKLSFSAHPSATIAQVALALGIFIRAGNDLHTPYESTPEFAFWEEFSVTSRSIPIGVLQLVPWHRWHALPAFSAGVKRGHHLRETGAFPAFARCLAILSRSDDPLAWVTLVGICRGVFAKTVGQKNLDDDFSLLKDLLAGTKGHTVFRARMGAVRAALGRKLRAHRPGRNPGERTDGKTTSR